MCACVFVGIVESAYTADFESCVILCKVLSILKKTKLLGQEA